MWPFGWLWKTVTGAPFAGGAAVEPDDEFDLCPVAKDPVERVAQLEEVCATYAARQAGMEARMRGEAVDTNPHYHPDRDLTVEDVHRIVSWQDGWTRADKILRP